MDRFVSKSSFKAKALEYFREVESTGKALIITDRGKPVLKIVPYADDPADVPRSLRGTVLRYDDPLAPVGLEDWEALLGSDEIARRIAAIAGEAQFVAWDALKDRLSRQRGKRSSR